MDNQRLLIWAIFLMLCWVTWQTWIADYAPPPVEQPAATATERISDAGSLTDTTIRAETSRFMAQDSHVRPGDAGA